MKTDRISWFSLLGAVAIVPLAVGTVPFGTQWSLGPFTAPPVVALGVLVGISAIAWAIGLLRGETELRGNRLLIALGVLVALLGVATALSLDPAYSLFGDGDDLNGLAVYVLCALSTVLVVAHCTSGKRVSELTSAVLYSGLAVAVISLAQQFLTIDPFGEVPAEQFSSLGWLITQGSSTLGNPDFTGSFLVVPAAIALSRALRPKATTAQRVVSGAAAVAIAAALVLTLTRGAWLGLAVGAVVYLALAVRRSRVARSVLTYAAIVAGVGLAVLLLFSGPDLVRRVSEIGDAGVSGRTLIWSESVRIIAADPVTGTGPAAFRLGWYGARQPEGLAIGAGAVGTDAHSYPLQLAAVAGVPALLAALVLAIGTAVAAARLAWNPKAGASDDYVAWWAAYIALGVTLLTAMATTPLLLTLFVATGLLLSPLAKTIRIAPTSASLVTVGVSLISLAALVVCVMQGAVHVQMRSALQQSPDAVAQVSRGARWNGTLGLLAARIAAQQVQAQAPALGAQGVSSALEGAFGPLAAAHPADYEITAEWGIQHFIAGDALGDAQLLERGLEISDAAVERYPNSLVLRTNRARALVDLGRVDEAAEELGDLAGADPGYQPARDVQLLIRQSR